MFFLARNYVPLSVDFSKIEEQLLTCGSETIEVVSSNGEIKEIVKYCNNRCCDNEGCIVHREYLYLRNHKSQIDLLNKSIRKPKAWVFTGWVKPYPIDRSFCREKLRLLFRLLSNRRVGSATEFSIHMEVKMRKNDWYLHFHVVLGGLRDFRLMQTKAFWGRYVRYEYPLHKEALENYISKYATKTPRFKSYAEKVVYFNFIYKTQTTRFSCGKSGYTKSGWLLMSRLEWEVYILFYREHTLGHGYFPFVDSYTQRNLCFEKKPPPQKTLDYLIF